MKTISERNYKETDREYRLIPDDGEKLIVPYSKIAELYQSISSKVRASGMTPSDMKVAAPLTITVYRNDNLETYAEQIMMYSKHSRQWHPSGYWLLREQYRELYTDAGGLQLPIQKKEVEASEDIFIY